MSWQQVKSRLKWLSYSIVGNKKKDFIYASLQYENEDVALYIFIYKNHQFTIEKVKNDVRSFQEEADFLINLAIEFDIHQIYISNYGVNIALMDWICKRANKANYELFIENVETAKLKRKYKDYKKLYFEN